MAEQLTKTEVAKLSLRINTLLKVGRRMYFETLTATDVSIINAYSQSIKGIEKIFQTMFETYGTKPSITELRKFNRLTKIQQELAKEITKLNGKVQSTIFSNTSSIFKTGYYATGFAVEVGTGINLGFNMLNKEAIKFAAADNLWKNSLRLNHGNLANQLSFELESLLRANAREVIISGIAEGKSLRSVTTSIKNRFGTALGRSKTIARTELHKSYMKGQGSAMNKAVRRGKELGINSVKTWVHNMIGKPRPDHVAATGDQADKEGFFNVGGEKLQAPGLGGDPSNNINCHCTLGYEILDADIPKTVTATPDQVKTFDNWRDFKNI